LWYAVALYLYSLQPPPNPNQFNQAAAVGQKLFNSNCAVCHTPPLYTNNKLTLAKGFQPTARDRENPDVMAISVETDPGGALLTRKGTGYYKVPSLKGVWYRGRFLHDGSLTSLEEMFDPRRLQADFQPKGWNPPGVTKRAVPGHEFGLHLTPEERGQLIAFLRTL
jgi:cytochrome c peroxidase